MKIPITIQMQPGENGAAALCMMLGYYKRYVPLKVMRDRCVSSRNGSSPEQIIEASEAFGLNAVQAHLDISELHGKEFPLMALWKRRYYVIIKYIRNGKVGLVDPAKGKYRMKLENFAHLYSGTVIMFSKGTSFEPGGKRESLFSLLRGRLSQFRSAAFLLAVLTLLSTGINLLLPERTKNFLDNFLGGPKETVGDVFFAESVLYFLMGAMLICTVLKTFLINRTSRNMSAASGSELFKKLFAQPLRFFETYSVGELMNRFENNITLDNSVIQSLVPRVIDVCTTVFYLVILAMYNHVMLLICLLIEAVYLFITLFIKEKMAINARSMATSSMKVLADSTKPLFETSPEQADYLEYVRNIKGDIRLENLVFRYPDAQTPCLDGVSLDIKSGEKVAVVGESGCGKSTLLKTMIGMETPSDGKVYYDNKDIDTLNLKSLRRNMGLVFQFSKVFPGTIAENVCFAATGEVRDEEIWEALDKAAIGDEIREMPLGLGTEITESNSSGFSGGQRQRILLARAFLNQPKMLLLDEATSALDNLTQNRVLKSILESKATVIMVAHRLSTVIGFDRIVMLEKGKIVEEGTYEQLMERSGKFAALVKKQLVSDDRNT